MISLSTIDHWKSRCKGWILRSTPYTMISLLSWIDGLKQNKIRQMCCIWRSQSSDYEEYYLLKCDIMLSSRSSSVFQRNTLPPSSGSKSKPIKQHVACLARWYIILKLSSACFIMRTVTLLIKINTIKLLYFLYFHSIMSYGVVF
jgi:hypothetical protein